MATDLLTGEFKITSRLKVSLEILSTPGHTPEHISLLLRDQQQGKEAFAIFTGDTLFNLDVGRPDLLHGRERKLEATFYQTLLTHLVPLMSSVQLQAGLNRRD